MFGSILNQMAFLFTLVILGYILTKLKVIPENSEVVLSKLENYLFIPALVLGTFISNFTVEKLQSSGLLMIGSLVLLIIIIPIAGLIVKLCTKDVYLQNIYLYGLCFSNFSFMGNAIVSALFPDIFLEYIIFTLVLWSMIYVWGVPSLLVKSDEHSGGLMARFKAFLNPMFICTVIGILIGLSGIKMPLFVDNVISSVGGCMSPMAMLITGMTIAKIDLKAVLKVKSMYVITAIRLVALPLAFIGVYALLKVLGVTLSETFVVCATASLAMPLGLNTIVIPSAYGLDTTAASGMALVSHTLSILTIPLIFNLLETVM